MKRKTLIAILAAVAALAIGGFAFSACAKTSQSGNEAHNSNPATTEINSGEAPEVKSETVTACAHEYSEWTVGYAPTCTSIGYNVRTCEKCGDLDYQILDAKGHSYKTVTYNQSIHFYECTTCKELVTAEHNFGENDTCTFCKYVADYTLGLLYYPVDNNQSYSVRVGDGKNLENIVIPSSYRGLPVTEIAVNGFYYCPNLKSVVIPDSVKKINNSAFFNCPNLSDVKFPATLEEIGNNVFYKCTSLEEFTLPENLIKIGNGIFRQCNSLTKIDIPKDWTTIPKYMYFKCEGLVNIEIPENITSIDNGAFESCINLKSIKISDNVTFIGAQAFWNCSTLESVNLPDKLTEIDYGVFQGCTSIKSIILNDNITTIGSKAFFECSALESIELSVNLQNIGAQAFSGTAIKKLALKNGSTTLGGFGGCESLAEVVLPETITLICSGALTECAKLERITFNGTMAQWKAVEKQSGWKTADNIITDFYVDCTDGTLEYIW